MLAYAGVFLRGRRSTADMLIGLTKLISKSNAYTNTPKSIQICMESIEMNWKSYDIMENSKENRGKYAKLYKIAETHKNTQHSHVIHENVTIWVAEKSSW